MYLLEEGFGGKDLLLLYGTFTYDSEIGGPEMISRTVATKLLPLFCLCGGRRESGMAVLSLSAEAAGWLLCCLCNQRTVLPRNRENQRGGNCGELTPRLKVLRHWTVEEVNPLVDCDCPQVAWWEHTTERDFSVWKPGGTVVCFYFFGGKIRYFTIHGASVKWS